MATAFKDNKKVSSTATDRIIVIGQNCSADVFTVLAVAEWLAAAQYGDDAILLLQRKYKRFDMATSPKKGDGIDAITAETTIVVALHLYGIDKEPGGFGPPADQLLGATPYYCRKNHTLLELCMQKKIKLFCSGDQPWMGQENRTKLSESLFLYEPFKRIKESL